MGLWATSERYTFLSKTWKFGLPSMKKYTFSNEFDEYWHEHFLLFRMKSREEKEEKKDKHFWSQCRSDLLLLLLWIVLQ